MDSRLSTLEHQKVVANGLITFAQDLLTRAKCHDDSKLCEPEKSGYDRALPKLQSAEYGTNEF